MAARPSPRPVRPRPSVVVADRLTGAPPRASLRTFSASARRGPILGRLPTTWTATLPIAYPAAPSSRATSRSKSVPDAPDQRGSPVPKTAPRPRSPAADSNASRAACAATSPSEPPASPSPPPGNSRPATHSGRPDAKGWTSVPTPTLGSCEFTYCCPAVRGFVPRKKLQTRRSRAGNRRATCTAWDPASAGQDLVEERLGLVLIGLFRQRELADQYLPGLGQHSLLASRQAALFVATPQVAHDLGNLVDVPGGELFEVRLVAPGPVGRLLGVGRTQHLEHLLQTLLAHHVTNTHEFGVLRWDTYCQVTLVDLQDQVGLVLTFDGAVLDGFDPSSPMVGVDDSVADRESHVTSTPSAVTRIPRAYR